MAVIRDLSGPQTVRRPDDGVIPLVEYFWHAAQKLVARNRAKRGLICTGPPMGDQEDQETPFQEMGGHRLAAKTAWVRAFIREARKREYTIEDIVALLDEPGMTAETVVERILSH